MGFYPEFSLAGRFRRATCPISPLFRSAVRFSFFFALFVLGGLRVSGFDLNGTGPLFEGFELTLSPGHRTEAAGPFYYDEEQESHQIWAVPPFFSLTRYPGSDSEEFNFLYPVLSYIRYGQQYRFQIAQVLAWAGGPTQAAKERKRFTIFPIYFQQRSSNPSDNYTAVVPFYGHLKKRLFRDEIYFVMFPIYSETRKRDVVTDNYLYPFFHLRHGEGLRGWQFWPLVGHEHKDVTTRTNNFQEVKTVPGHDELFVLWPFFFNSHTGLGTDNPQWQQASLPAYAFVRSPQRDSTTVLWPLFSHVNDREKKYREWDAPWPVIVFAHGAGKTTKRVWPFFSRAHSPTQESDSFLWPFYKYNRYHSEALERERTRILFLLYSDMREKNVSTGTVRRRLDFLPFFSHRRDSNGNSRWQVLAPIEPILPDNPNIEREYSPIWSVWRSEKNARTGAASQSLLWNFYRRQTTPTSSKTSAFFGLYQRRSDAGGKRTRLFFIKL